ncbi:MAG: pyridoxamine 5'-phosphate oxidase family protein [Elusimicrobiota bacterium]|jgi:nitroimidazol reductase NimA-like FMN-containing flavoprotein (pyridoxamine 5'-phosphate oxidase superfamily)|nr:pyridoxamine 5'-phosphate oxidase family protein [Elusimicrobiota bacterium]
MRRADREVKDFSEIIRILDGCNTIHLALCLDNKPYSVPINFGYIVEADNKLSIYLHGAKEGRKHTMLEQNPNVSFSGIAFEKFFGSDETQRYTTHYQSIIGEGKISIINALEEKVKGLNLLMKHCGFKESHSYPQQALEAVRVLKIEVETIAGKQNGIF